MVASSFRYFLCIVLLSFTWALQQNNSTYAHTTVNPQLENKYSSCRAVFKKLSALPHPKVMATFGHSIYNASNVNEMPPPFSKDYNNCIWCNSTEINCIKLKKEGRESFCVKTTIYIGPLREMCLSSEKRYVQVILKKQRKEKVATANSSNEYEWKISILRKRYPKKVYIPIGGIKRNTTLRGRRSTEVCPFPEGLETASLNCRIYPSFVTCTQMCAFGYTLQGGITQNMKCMKKDNVWKPAGFQECQPFVDCNVALTSSGNVKCSFMSLTSAPSCDVSCLHYEDKDEVPTNTHSCNIEGKWDPPLPFCAQAGQGLVLTTPPKKKLHES